MATAITSAFSLLIDAIKSNVFFMTFTAAYGVTFAVVSSVCVENLCAARVGTFAAGVVLVACCLVASLFDDAEGKSTFLCQRNGANGGNQQGKAAAADGAKGDQGARRCVVLFMNASNIPTDDGVPAWLKKAIIAMQAITNGVTLMAIVFVSVANAQWFSSGQAIAAACYTAPAYTPPPPNITPSPSDATFPTNQQCDMSNCVGCSVTMGYCGVMFSVAAILLFIVRGVLNAIALGRKAAKEREDKEKEKEDKNKKSKGARVEALNNFATGSHSLFPDRIMTEEDPFPVCQKEK